MRFRHSMLATAIVAVGLLFAASSSTADESSEVEALTGKYRSTLSKSQARKSIDKRIDSLVDDMAFYKRPFARSKLESRTPPCIDLTIGYDDGDMQVACDDRRPAAAKLNGARRDFKPSGGDPVEVSYALSNGNLVQKFYSENGVRTNVYSLSGNGKILKLRAKIQSSKLPRPLTYTRTFQRK